MNSLLKVFTISFALIAGESTAQITKQWESRYQETGYTDEAGQKVISDANGNVFVLGYSMFDALLVKYDKTGKLIWSFQSGRGVFLESSSNLRNFKMDAAGNIYVLLVGRYPSRRIALLKINPSGQLVWKNEMEGAEENAVLQIHPDGSPYVFYKAATGELKLCKYSGAGDLVWSKSNPYVSTEQYLVRGLSIIGDRILTWGSWNGTVNYLKSALCLYNIQGTLLWQNSYFYNSSSTYITGVDYHKNTLVVSYFIDEGGNRFHQIVKYNFTTGGSLGSYLIGIGNPIEGMMVGADSAVYVLDNTSNYTLAVKKYSLNGSFFYSNSYPSLSELRFYIREVIPNKMTKTLDVFVQTENWLTNVHTHSAISFKPNQTYSVLATVTTSKTGVDCLGMAEDDQYVYVVGSYYNGVNYKKDIFVEKLSKTNLMQWESTFVPTNSLRHDVACVTMDGSGNTFVGGLLASNFGVKQYGVIKYDASGNQVWARKIPPSNSPNLDGIDTKVMAIAVNSLSEVFVTGGLDMITSSTTHGLPPVKIHTSKLNANGNVIWTNQSSGITDDRAVGFQLSQDTRGNTYVLGANVNAANASRNTMILLKYNPNGILLWEKRFSNVDYTNYSSTAPDTEIPRMKIVGDHVYVVNEGVTAFSQYFVSHPLEVRKFDENGNETLIKKIDCTDACNQHMYLFDFLIGSNGNLYLLYNEYTYNQGWYDPKTHVIALSPTGEIVWKNTRNKTENSFDGGLILNAQNEVFAVTAGSTLLTYVKISSTGTTVWETQEPLKNLELDLGHPCFVFVKADGNPVFMSTNFDEPLGNYYFITERDKGTGEILQHEVFDSGYGTMDYTSYYGLADHLIAFHKVTGTDQFIITGVIADKHIDAETIVTLKYNVQSLSSAFTATPRKIVAGKTISYTDQSTGSPTAWQWTFEGGTPESFTGKTPPPIAYSQPGKHTVKLSVTRGSTTNEVLQLEYIEVLQKLAADFNISNANPEVGEQVDFTDISVGPIANRTWSFEGATTPTSTSQSPLDVVYLTAGTYLVTMEINNDIDSDIITKQVIVKDIPVVAIEEQVGVLLSIYPTVTSGRFQIEADPSSVQELKLYDSIGKKIGAFDPSDNSFDISHQIQGVYFLRMLYKDRWIVARIIKQ